MTFNKYSWVYYRNYSMYSQQTEVKKLNFFRLRFRLDKQGRIKLRHLWRRGRAGRTGDYEFVNDKYVLVS